jgi:hypothetical protein
MTAINRFGEEVRGFQVIVAQPEKKHNLRYPVITGEEALRLMLDMEKRGRETIAETSSDYCEEILTLEEMKQIYKAEWGGE